MADLLGATMTGHDVMGVIRRHRKVRDVMTAACILIAAWPRSFGPRGCLKRVMWSTERA
jgi:DNA-binding PucR family transcriptional regulator